MKRHSALLLSVLALLVNACEKHPASRLPGEHDTQFGVHAAGHGGVASHETKHEAKLAGDHPAPAKSEKPVAAGEARPGEAPKFFPEKK